MDWNARKFQRDRPTRASITLECDVRQNAGPWRTVCLEDISPWGFRVSAFLDCRPEAPLRIRIPGLDLLTAHVRWHRQAEVGCEFASPLHVAVFDHLVREANRRG